MYTPERELVDAYLYEIARGYNVDWVPEPPASAAVESKDDEENDEAGGGVEVEEDAVDGEEDGDKSKKSVKDREDSSDNAETAPVKSNTTYPAGTEKDAWADKSTVKDTPVNAAPAKKLSPEEELAQRFERLKKI